MLRRSGDPRRLNGAVTMMVGVDNDGKVTGISIISHTETAGLGATAAADTDAGRAFRDQFIGMSGTVSVTKDAVKWMPSPAPPSLPRSLHRRLRRAGLRRQSGLRRLRHGFQKAI